MKSSVDKREAGKWLVASRSGVAQLEQLGVFVPHMTDIKNQLDRTHGLLRRFVRFELTRVPSPERRWVGGELDLYLL